LEDFNMWPWIAKPKCGSKLVTLKIRSEKDLMAYKMGLGERLTQSRRYENNLMTCKTGTLVPKRYLMEHEHKLNTSATARININDIKKFKST
jgi:hypothetical protein